MTKRKDSEGDLSLEHRSDRRCKSFADAPASSMGGIVGPRSSRRKRSRDDTGSSHRKSKKPFEPSQSSRPRRDGRLAVADAGDSTDPDDRKGVRETIGDILREFPGLPEELARQLQRSRNLKGSEVGRSEQIKPRKLKQRLQSRSDAIPELTPFSESPSFVAVVDDVSQRISVDLKQILTEYKVSKFAETVRAQRELRNLTLETAFCDIYGGDSEGREARKVALLASKCVISLSSFSGERRRRVCSGFVIQSDSSTRIYKILSAATLIRSLTKYNAVDSDLRVKVCLPSGVITDAFISMIDLHYNLLLLEVKSEEKLDEGILIRNVVTEGAVLALGRFYDDGSLMCAKGNIRTESTDSDCSELSLSSCQTTMAGVGGPLVNYSGQILGMNFYGVKNTPFLSMAIVVRCLEQWKHFGQIARPCIGFSYISIDAVPLKALEKCPYAENGLFIPKVAKGSFADLAGLSVGDVITRCAGKDLSNAPELGALLLDICTKQMQPDFRKITLELVVVKQKDGSRMKITIDADALRECDYYRWSVPGPKYSHQNIGGEDVMRLL